MLPLSTKLGNAISNDGDALFPAIAIAPKAALVATLYSAIPAAIVAYGWLFFRIENLELNHQGSWLSGLQMIKQTIHESSFRDQELKEWNLVEFITKPINGRLVSVNQIQWNIWAL